MPLGFSFNQTSSTGWGHDTDYNVGWPLSATYAPYNTPPDTFDDGHNCCIDEVANRPNITVSTSTGDGHIINGTYTWYGSADGWNNYGTYCMNGSKTSPVTGSSFNNTVCIHKNNSPTSTHANGNWVFAQVTVHGTWNYDIDQDGTDKNNLGTGPVPFSIDGDYKELQCCSMNLGNVSITSTASYTETSCATGTDSPGANTGTGCGDPHITPIFGEKYDL